MCMGGKGRQESSSLSLGGGGAPFQPEITFGTRPKGNGKENPKVEGGEPRNQTKLGREKKTFLPAILSSIRIRESQKSSRPPRSKQYYRWKMILNRVTHMAA